MYKYVLGKKDFLSEQLLQQGGSDPKRKIVRKNDKQSFICKFLFLLPISLNAPLCAQLFV